MKMEKTNSQPQQNSRNEKMQRAKKAESNKLNLRFFYFFSPFVVGTANMHLLSAYGKVTDWSTVFFLLFLLGLFVVVVNSSSPPASCRVLLLLKQQSTHQLYLGHQIHFVCVCIEVKRIRWSLVNKLHSVVIPLQEFFESHLNLICWSKIYGWSNYIRKAYAEMMNNNSCMVSWWCWIKLF